MPKSTARFRHTGTFLVVVRMQKSMEARCSWVFPKQYFSSGSGNPDQLDGAGHAFAYRKLDEEWRLEFEAAFARARALGEGDKKRQRRQPVSAANQKISWFDYRETRA